MPEKRTRARARGDARQGKSGSTQAGEFVREEMEHVREGRHGARSSKQAIAIGLSKARRAGVKVPARGSPRTRRKAAQDSRRGRSHRRTSSRRSRATASALKREGHRSTSHKSLSRQSHSAALKRSSRSRSAASRKAARTRALRK